MLSSGKHGRADRLGTLDPLLRPQFQESFRCA